MLKVYRPITGPVLVWGWTPEQVRAVVGGGVKLDPERRLPDRAYYVARAHLGTILAAAAEVGEVRLTTEHFARRTCVASCWHANPLTVLDCVCACAGRNHASGGGPDAEDLAVILDEDYGDLHVTGEYLERTQIIPRKENPR